MPDIFAKIPNGSLYLTKGDTARQVFQYSDGDYPSGAALKLVIDGEDYPFTVSGDQASVAIEPNDADDIADRAPWRLEYKVGSDTPDVLAYGQVKRRDPRDA